MVKFELNEIEEERVRRFIKEHKCLDVTKMFSYIFTPTGIGVGIEIKCSCGVVKDVTDIDCW